MLGLVLFVGQWPTNKLPFKFVFKFVKVFSRILLIITTYTKPSLIPYPKAIVCRSYLSIHSYSQPPNHPSIYLEARLFCCCCCNSRWFACCCCCCWGKTEKREKVVLDACVKIACGMQIVDEIRNNDDFDNNNNNNNESGYFLISQPNQLYSPDIYLSNP